MIYRALLLKPPALAEADAARKKALGAEAAAAEHKNQELMAQRR